MIDLIFYFLNDRFIIVIYVFNLFFFYNIIVKRRLLGMKLVLWRIVFFGIV